MKHIALLHSAQQGHVVWANLWLLIKPYLVAGHKLQIMVSPERRSTAQNAMLWALLSDVASQVVWHGQNLDQDSWKNIFSASLKKQRVVPGIDGGFVVLGQSTSQMSKAEFSELCELILAFGADKGVEWTQETP